MTNINNFLNPFEAYTIPLDDWINEAIAFVGDRLFELLNS